jgi:4-amino-4-deoxy-L-arabinose transferase-like glycosyltransferase
MYGHTRPLYFYGPVFLMMTFPWTFLLIPAFRRRLEPKDQVLIWWAVVPLVFFSFSGSKLPGYILPIVPPLAIFCAKELWQPRSDIFRAAVYIQAGAMFFIGVAFGFFGDMLNVNPHVDPAVIAEVSFSMAAALIAIALWLGPPVLAVFNVLSVTLLVLAATNFVFPRFDQTETVRPWSIALKSIAPDSQETICLYKTARWMEYGLQFYHYRNARSIGSPDELIHLMGSERKVLCIAEDKTLEELSRLPNVEVKVQQTIGTQTAFWARPEINSPDGIQPVALPHQETAP